MMDQTMNQGGDILNFVLPKNQSSYIKVIGVGGGGSNAVNHMFRAGIKGVDFIVCNTDAQALESSPVPVKIHLGKGLGAGNVPQVAKDAAEEKREEIKASIQDARMLFITAGMGGGTGTGAAPVVASVAKEIELVGDEVTRILTVAIVTTPFTFEGRKRQEQAKAGIAELRKTVDAILVINNDKLREFGKMTLMEAFAMADNVLTTAAKGISEIITVRSYVQIDFKDVNTVMHDSGVALMGFGTADGENRAKDAALMAMDSPLLNDNSIQGAKNMLLYLSYGPEEPLCMDEIEMITNSILQKAGDGVDLIWGAGEDESLGASLNITLIATGFTEKRALGERDIRHYTLDEPVSHRPAGIVSGGLSERGLAAGKPVSAGRNASATESPVQTPPVRRTIAVLDLSDETPVFMEEGSEQGRSEMGSATAPVVAETPASVSCSDTVGQTVGQTQPCENMEAVSDIEAEVDSWFEEINFAASSASSSASDFGEPEIRVVRTASPEVSVGSGNAGVNTVSRDMGQEDLFSSARVEVPSVSEDIVQKTEVSAVSSASGSSAVTSVRTSPVTDVAEKPGVSLSEGLLRGRCEATAERMKRLREFSGKIRTPQGLREIEEVPAYVRQNRNLDSVVPSYVSEVSRHTIGKDGSVSYNNPPFLADQAD